ncbi:MAG TPA: ClpXP protease specificity-enhancing factor SspB [Polyangiaceae bacterium]|nr:MAG: Stringent starvation protein B [Deltaproteobacteria bacterium ADurb.Bin207]HOT10334.1 ClpXP protease specificity-enhancing factor SspB [Polyangiaceae bacterium]HPB95433.1 ClpXP protease specificity-enhancing factor SspB [Polyangiaceae bacterium]HPY19290.1 ClpXP protease specificity-enhancing factor SspB [Polyangiaceae bacterium]HQF24326.1 ClpXP protease specificity-enhancing factor SspB [Polyangiaceae bacterium]
MQPKPPDKQQLMNYLLAEAPSVFIHLDPRQEKVVVPPRFRKNPMLILEIGLNMRVPIPDLNVDAEGVTCTLSFGGKPYWCQLPWPSVFALVGSDQRGYVWFEQVPKEVADRYVSPSKSPAPKLKAVDDSEKSEPRTSDKRVVALHASKPSRPPAPDTTMPDTDGNAAGVLEPLEDRPEPSQDDPKKKSKRKLPSYLRVVK